MSNFTDEILSPVLLNIKNNPNNNAFCINKKYYTYRFFGECISKIFNAINESKEESKVLGLIANDDIDTYASIFALWLAGKCYVPLHPNQPIDRCLDIISQVSISLILDSSLKSRYLDVPVISTCKLENTEILPELVDSYSDLELAYILFTSGSTGIPKGVMLTRMNLSSFINAFWETGIITNHEDRCLQCFDLTFDVSIQSFLVGLIKGACVFTVPVGQIKYSYVAGLIEEYHLTFVVLAPSILRYLQPYFNEINASSIKISIFTAEACPLSMLEDWCKYAYNSDIYDFYGPTEATIYCTYYKFRKKAENKTANGIISIGKPLKNVTAIIVDEKMNILPKDNKGELCVAGIQVTQGYWGNSDKNLSSFFVKTINNVDMVFYHTGDLCYCDSEGDLMYLGRIDNQVKIQGYRIEIGEIEYYARSFLKELNVVAVPFINNYDLYELCLFIESDPFDLTELLNFLESKLPHYMVPSLLRFERKFPLNTNDKIDRIALRQRLN